MNEDLKRTSDIWAQLLDGGKPNGVAPENCGDYAEAMEIAYEAYSEGGTKEVKRAWRIVASKMPDLRDAIAGGTSGSPLVGLDTFTAKELMDMELPPLRYLVDDVFPEGTSLLAAPPKIGKTFLCLNVAVAIAQGGQALGKVPVDEGRVFFIDLDGSKRGMQRRLKVMLQGEKPPSNLHIVRDWERLDEGGMSRLEALLRAYDDTRVVVIDTLKGLRPKDSGQRNMYDTDYEAVAPIRSLGEKYNVSFIVVHHTNKRTGGDPLNLVSGSTGLTGAVDNVLIMQKERGSKDAQLTVIPREEEEAELALSFDPHINTWTLRGTAAEIAKTDERQAVLDALKNAETPMRASDIAGLAHIDQTPKNVSYLLGKLADQGKVLKAEKYGYYKYQPPGSPRTPGSTRSPGTPGSGSATTDQAPF